MGGIMGVYVNEKLQVPVEHEAAKEAAAKVAEQWRKDHADDVAVEPTYDEATGRQTNRMDRTETVVRDEPTFKITQYSDGTVRSDSRLPPAPVTAATIFTYSPADMAQLRSTEGKATVQVTENGMQVSGPAVETQPITSNWLTSSPREEWGDNFRRP